MLTPKERAARFIAWQRVKQADKEFQQFFKGQFQDHWSGIPTLPTAIDEILEELDR